MVPPCIPNRTSTFLVWSGDLPPAHQTQLHMTLPYTPCIFLQCWACAQLSPTTGKFHEYFLFAEDDYLLNVQVFAESQADLEKRRLCTIQFVNINGQ